MNLPHGGYLTPLFKITSPDKQRSIGLLSSSLTVYCRREESRLCAVISRLALRARPAASEQSSDERQCVRQEV